MGTVTFFCCFPAIFFWLGSDFYFERFFWPGGESGRGGGHLHSGMYQRRALDLYLGREVKLLSARSGPQVTPTTTRSPHQPSATSAGRPFNFCTMRNSREKVNFIFKPSALVLFFWISQLHRLSPLPDCLKLHHTDFGSDLFDARYAAVKPTFSHWVEFSSVTNKLLFNHGIPHTPLQ